MTVIANRPLSRESLPMPSDLSASSEIPSTDGLVADGAVAALRAQRQKVLAGTQGSHDVLFARDDLGGLSLHERLLAAILASRLSGDASLEAHYLALGLEAGLSQADLALHHEATGDRVPAILAFVETLILRPVKGDAAALATLSEAGLNTESIVVLSQLIAFLSYQIRLAAGLRALAGVQAVSETAA